MSIDTEIPGSPDSIEATAEWLAGSLGAALGAGVGHVASARTAASGDWAGAAAGGFVARMGVAVEKIDLVQEGTDSVARELAAYAGSLRRLQERMSDIRAAGAAAGLVVSGFVIEPPGAGPTHPGRPPAGRVSPTLVDAHAASLDAWADHRAKVAAYEIAAAEAAVVRGDLARSTRRLEDEYRGLDGPAWALTAIDIAGGFGAGALSNKASSLRVASRALSDQAGEYLALIEADNTGFTNHDLDYWEGRGREAAEQARKADDLDRAARAGQLKLGGALAVVGIGLDVAAGESTVQAVASNGGGFAASVAAGVGTGALVGSFVPVPGVGTAVGAVVGAGVGIVASGAIDSLFEEGPDVANALSDGWESLTDTGGAVGDGVGALVDGVGGLLD
ncbi:hypothetical protein I601_1926 [Nocardioides dokdonensis FR1436]|uniref:Uncharacterized protein n=1 Tax=Nocardioides dokdonensis FR1436 TaxID=1300347 RepID=A0A1A9GJV7_9ACTN|nr:hypothetical protein [Nocardioides dokdonensis]ANH38356.1 hypothetical protein I601_1926 [Nocardioides dokdonensis FR1436]